MVCSFFWVYFREGQRQKKNKSDHIISDQIVAAKKTVNVKLLVFTVSESLHPTCEVGHNQMNAVPQIRERDLKLAAVSLHWSSAAVTRLFWMKDVR